MSEIKTDGPLIPESMVLFYRRMAKALRSNGSSAADTSIALVTGSTRELLQWRDQPRHVC